VETTIENVVAELSAFSNHLRVLVTDPDREEFFDLGDITTDEVGGQTVVVIEMAERVTP
jgi:hypothetical protein